MINPLTKAGRAEMYGNRQYNLAMEWLWLGVAAVAITPEKDLWDAWTHGTLLASIQHSTAMQNAEACCSVALFGSLAYVATQIHRYYATKRASLTP